MIFAEKEKFKINFFFKKKKKQKEWKKSLKHLDRNKISTSKLCKKLQFLRKKIKKNRSICYENKCFIKIIKNKKN